MNEPDISQNFRVSLICNITASTGQKFATDKPDNFVNRAKHFQLHLLTSQTVAEELRR